MSNPALPNAESSKEVPTKERTPSIIDLTEKEKYDADPDDLPKEQDSQHDCDLWSAEDVAFMRSGVHNIHSKGRWHGVKPLGQGTFGRAGLWEKRNDSNRLVDVCRPSHCFNDFPC